MKTAENPVHTEKLKSIDSLEKLAEIGGKVIKYSFNSGKDWRYALVSKDGIQTFVDGEGREVIGVMTYEEKLGGGDEGVDAMWAIDKKFFKRKNFCVFVIPEQETEFMRFSFCDENRNYKY